MGVAIIRHPLDGLVDPASLVHAQLLDVIVHMPLPVLRDSRAPDEPVKESRHQSAGIDEEDATVDEEGGITVEDRDADIGEEDAPEAEDDIARPSPPPTTKAPRM